MGRAFNQNTFTTGLSGSTPLPPREQDRLAAALNDELTSQGHSYRVPYTTD
jgi:hypothetical protein